MTKILSIIGCAFWSAVAVPAIERKKVQGEVVIHKQTGYFIDIEAPLDKVWIGCSKGPGETGNSYMAFHILNGDESYEFHYRRPLSVVDCLKEEKEYDQVLGKSKTVRLVGDHPYLGPGPQPETSKRIPPRFGKAPKIWSSVFLRMQAQGRCKAYFQDHCDLPKNYWAGMTPE